MSNLSLGSRGPDVTRLQLQLNRQLFPRPGLAEDSIFGPLTRNAVVAFQRQAGIVARRGTNFCTAHEVCHVLLTSAFTPVHITNVTNLMHPVDINRAATFQLALQRNAEPIGNDSTINSMTIARAAPAAILKAASVDDPRLCRRFLV